MDIWAWGGDVADANAHLLSAWDRSVVYVEQVRRRIASTRHRIALVERRPDRDATLRRLHTRLEVLLAAEHRAVTVEARLSARCRALLLTPRVLVEPASPPMRVRSTRVVRLPTD